MGSQPPLPNLLQHVHQSQSHRLRGQLGQEQRRLGLKEERFLRDPITHKLGFWFVFVFVLC